MVLAENILSYEAYGPPHQKSCMQTVKCIGRVNPYGYNQALS